MTADYVNLYETKLHTYQRTSNALINNKDYYVSNLLPEHQILNFDLHCITA